jgi:hypothetical protein
LTKVLAITVFIVGTISCVHPGGRQPTSDMQSSEKSKSETKSETKNAARALALFHKNFDPICTQGFSETVSPQQIKVIVETMANRDHRLWHYFWHATRNSWHDLKDEERAFFLSFDPRWMPPRLLGKPKGITPSSTSEFDPQKNNAGEDFLFMHHMMVKELFQSLSRNDLACISPWTQLPAKDDKLWPVPVGSTDAPKDDDSYSKMEVWRKKFQDPGYLKNKTLGQIGYTLESSLHNNMHMRWATDEPPAKLGERPDITVEFLKNGLQKYDDPKYNWLADPYSAHVNRVFWKLHGLVDLSIFAWLNSNGYSTIEVDCTGESDCYEWKGTWIGAPPHGTPTKGGMAGHSGHEHGDGRDNQDGRSGSGAKSPSKSFADAFGSAVDDFVNGTGGSGAKGPPRDSDSPPTKSARPAPVKPAEKARRLKVIRSAMAKLNRNSPPKHGVLNSRLIKDLSSPLYDDPAEFVHQIDKIEERH